jgi:hypothetical protein
MITVRLNRDQAVYIRAFLAGEFNADPTSAFKESTYNLLADAIEKEDRELIQLGLKIRQAVETND